MIEAQPPSNNANILPEFLVRLLVGRLLLTHDTDFGANALVMHFGGNVVRVPGFGALSAQKALHATDTKLVLDATEEQRAVAHRSPPSLLAVLNMRSLR
eukprot:CAMPEP_0180814188 /NCGR_PEP_ID=MMETSP1038_2-20121128/66936_1 /TAXON_ID=632150 /ORGANISM="Azadinium spinosum, Strain 3D9" /LENGTH=98 /DNA_ID=CAMNT_0022855831 /DNA_START=288 /DNA_END=584 /DNA_ORIENTATION=+